MPNSFQTAVDIWQRMGFLQRILLISVLLACGGAAALLLGWARQPDMALLYTGLDPEDAAQIVEKIRDADTTYELRNGGTAVYVPSDTVYTLRLELAGEGLPSGGREGYGLLDNEKIGTSPFSQRINYARAIEGELAKTISLFDAVAAARVHIVRPDSKLFQGTNQGASATVALRLRPGRKLTQQNVAAVVHLVAGSVDSLSHESVVVVDSRGNLLSSGTDDDFATGAGNVLDYKSQVEQYLARKAEDMLTLVLGPGRATVKVDATIATKTISETVEQYSPDEKVPTKEELMTKSSSGGSTPAEAAAAITEKEETITTEYEVGRTVTQSIEMSGQITSLSVAAFVDLSAPEPSPTGAEEGAAPASPPTSPAPELDIKDVEEVIRNAVGREFLKEPDSLKVVSRPFYHPAPPADDADAENLFASPEFYLDVARHGSLGVLVIGALLMLKIFGGSKRKGAPMPAEGALEAAALGQGQLLTAGPAQLNERIAAALQENPDEVKRLFRTWVESEQGGV